MPETTTALLVSNGREPFEKLELALEDQGVKIFRAGSSAEAQAILEQPDLPRLVFTDTTFADGDWEDVLDSATRRSVPVILVSRSLDFELYLHSMELGAFEFIVPPFVGADLTHIVRCAAENQRDQRARRASIVA
jgi:DNA-binding NtrC family response regulator